MAKYDSLLEGFKNTMPDQIQKPANMAFNEFLEAQQAKWGEFSGLISQAGQLARKRYGPDVRVDTAMGQFDAAGQVHHAFIDMQRPGVPKLRIPMSLSLNDITIDGITYTEAELDQAAEVVLARIKAFLNQPIA